MARLRESTGIGRGRDDILPCDPTELFIIEGYNVREMDSADARAELDELKALIKEHGVRTPLVVRYHNEKKWIIQGHRRHKVTMELRAEYEASGGTEGRFIEFVPIMAEPGGTKDEERDFDLHTSNSGSPLKPLELANLIYRLNNQRGLPLEDIAKRLGKSIEVVKNRLKERGALSQEIQDAVKANGISVTTAAKAVEELGAEATLKLIKDNEAQGRKTRPRDVRQASNKPAKPAKAQARAVPPEQTLAPEPAPTLAPAAEPTPTPTVAERIAAAGALEEPAPQQTAGRPRIAAIPHQALLDLLEALKPFAALANDCDLDAWPDDHMIEVRVEHIKKAAIVMARATGE